MWPPVRHNSCGITASPCFQAVAWVSPNSHPHWTQLVPCFMSVFFVALSFAVGAAVLLFLRAFAGLMPARTVSTAGFGPAVLRYVTVITTFEALHQATPCNKLLHQLHIPPSTKPCSTTRFAASGVSKKAVREECLFPELPIPRGHATRWIRRPVWSLLF